MPVLLQCRIQILAVRTGYHRVGRAVQYKDGRANLRNFALIVKNIQKRQGCGGTRIQDAPNGRRQGTLQDATHDVVWILRTQVYRGSAAK